jgi:type I restriction enzyme S subunit
MKKVMNVKIRNADIGVGIYLAILANIRQQWSRKMTKVQTEINTSTIRNPNSALPEGCRWVKLGDVCEVISKGTTPTTYGYSFVSSGIPFLRAEDVTGDAIDFSSSAFHITKETHDFLNRSKLHSGDLLITIAGTLGRVGYIPKDAPEANCNQAVAFARVDPMKADVKFLCHVLQIPEVLQPFIELKAGGTIQNLNLEQVQSIEIPLPPLTEQKRIASKVQELMQEVERARNACEKQLEAAKALPSVYLRDVFESEEAKKWEKKRLGEVCEFRKGRKPITLYEEPREGRFPYILIESFSGAYQKFTDDESCPKCSKEDVLLVWDGARSGLCTTGLDGCIGSTISALRSKSELYSEYLFWFIRHHYKDLNKMVRGTGIPHLEKEYVYSLAIPLPPLTIQQLIASELKGKMTYTEKLRTSIEKQLEALNALPQSILRKAFRGEL